MKSWLVAWHVIPLVTFVVTLNPNVVVWWFNFQAVLAIIFVIFAKEAKVTTMKID